MFFIRILFPKARISNEIVTSYLNISEILFSKFFFSVFFLYTKNTKNYTMAKDNIFILIMTYTKKEQKMSVQQLYIQFVRKY